jgi:hypothetical protein
MFQLPQVSEEQEKNVKTAYILGHVELAINIREKLSSAEYITEANKLSTFINKQLDLLNQEYK